MQQSDNEVISGETTTIAFTAQNFSFLTMHVFLSFFHKLPEHSLINWEEDGEAQRSGNQIQVIMDNWGLLAAKGVRLQSPQLLPIILKCSQIQPNTHLEKTNAFLFNLSEV